MSQKNYIAPEDILYFFSTNPQPSRAGVLYAHMAQPPRGVGG